MSVKGTKAKGTYYVTLLRENNVWRLVSGRVELEDGQTINIEADGRTGKGGLKVGSNISIKEQSAGAQLSDEKAQTNGWQEVKWDEQKMIFLLPPDWKQERQSQRDIDYRPPQNRWTFMIASAWVFDADLPFDNPLQTQLRSMKERFNNGIIAGYATRKVDNTPGVVSLSSQPDNSENRREVTWSGYLLTDGKPRSIDIKFGAKGKDFPELEPQINSILDSIHFE